MAQQSKSESNGAEHTISGLGITKSVLPLDGAVEKTGRGRRLWQGLMLGRRDGVSFNRTIVESDRNSGTDTSAVEVQSRFLLVAVFGAWAGFLGLMAIVVTENAIQKSLGAIAVSCGLIVIFVGLSRVAGDRTGWSAASAPCVDDGRHDRVR